jgi:DNA-binding CsgD family transcriptional regulator
VLPLEREIELEAVADLVAGAASGRGGLLLVEGAAGVGKSTLLAHAEQTARDRGLTILRARGHELERAFGWGVARSLLETALTGEVTTGPARVVFGVDDSEPPASDAGFAILHALYRLTSQLAERAPLLLAVDDAHWADPASVRYLIYLLGRLSDQPIAVLVATRPVESDGGALAQLTTDPAARVHVLEPLHPDAVAVLVRRRLPEAGERFCRRCWELTAGNPLHVRELLVAIEQHAGPADETALAAAAELAARSLRRSVQRRLGALPPAAQALARAVAVFEDDAPLRLAAALADLALEDALGAAEQLERADVLRMGDPLGFTHPLVRAAAYGQLTFADRARTHRRAAELLAAEGAADEHVSAHLLHAIPAADAGVVAILRAAARRALAQGVPPAAVDYLDRALREPPAETDRATVMAELGQAEAVAGRPEAVAHLEAAVALAAEPAERAALLLEFGRALHHAGRLAEAGAAFERGRDEIEGGVPGLAADLEAAYLNSAMHAASRAADAYRRGDAILADLRVATRVDRELASTAMMMWLFAGRGRDDVLAVAHRLDAAGRLGAGTADSRTLPYVVGTLIWCDDFRAAAEALAFMFADAERRGSVRRFAMASQLRSRQLLCTGPIGDAVADARAAVEVWRGGRQMYLHAAGYCLVCALLEHDEADEAAAALAVGDAQQPASPFFAAFRHMAAGHLAAARSDDADALAAFLEAGRCLTQLLTVNPAVLPWRSEAGLAAQRLGRHDQARALIAEELQLAERFGAPRPIGVASRAAARLERGEVALQRLLSACDILAASGAHVEHARTLVELGAAIRRAGRAADARPTLRNGLALAEEIGAAALARRARDELRLAGGRARSSAGAVGGLTPSEQRVAALAAAGQTNRQIADELFLTVKSVEWHLGNTYRKLDIRGRGELAGRLA